MLPERWKIKLTESNLDTVGKFYDSICSVSTNCYSNGSNSGKFLCSHNNNDNAFILDKGEMSNGRHYANFCTSEDIPEITTEQFIKYIINREVYEIY